MCSKTFGPAILPSFVTCPITTIMQMVGDITLIKLKGSGSFGKIYKSTKEGRQEFFAVKKISRELFNKPQFKKYLENELKILNELNHPNICKIIEVKVSFNHYYLVMEYINGGSLSDCLEKYLQKNNRPFTEEIVQYLMRQIIDAFKYIHGKGIMHRDIKLENIMVNFSNETDSQNLNLLNAKIKIIDFGLAVEGLGFTFVGNIHNMDPIILKKFSNSMARKICESEEYDKKIDIWSIGVCCYEMLIGKTVFDAKTLEELNDKVEKGNYTVPITLSRDVVSFLNAMLQYDSKKRLSAEDLAEHPFLKKNVQDFQPIDKKKVSEKIDNQGLNINIKKNTTICSIFNKEDEKKTLNILSIKGDENNVQINRPKTMKESIASYSNSGNIYSQSIIKSNTGNYHSSKNVANNNNFNNNNYNNNNFN